MLIYVISFYDRHRSKTYRELPYLKIQIFIKYFVSHKPNLKIKFLNWRFHQVAHQFLFICLLYLLCDI